MTSSCLAELIFVCYKRILGRCPVHFIMNGCIHVLFVLDIVGPCARYCARYCIDSATAKNVFRGCHPLLWIIIGPCITLAQEVSVNYTELMMKGTFTVTPIK